VVCCFSSRCRDVEAAILCEKPAQVASGTSFTRRVGAARERWHRPDPLVEGLAKTGSLPPNYITKAQAEALGKQPGKALANFAPGKEIGGDVFENTPEDGRYLLPPALGRVWYEACLPRVRAWGP
jgi:hypothetical protein